MTGFGDQWGAGMTVKVVRTFPTFLLAPPVFEENSHFITRILVTSHKFL